MQMQTAALHVLTQREESLIENSMFNMAVQRLIFQLNLFIDTLY